jgi:twitching motility protein PilT
MIEFFPAVKQTQIRSILAGVLRGVISQRLLPRIGGGRMAAVEVMVNNARIADLIRENKAEKIPEAIAEGSFFHMQTFEHALLELVLGGDIDQDVASNAATNQHDFKVALEQALRRQAAGITKEDERMNALPQAATPAEEEPIPNLRVVPTDG